jgi:hypothetical protein
MAQTWYKQCRLISGNTTTVAWIDERYAKRGNTMIFKDADDNRRWEVECVYDHRRSEQDVKEHERDYLNQRSMSDI